MLGKIVRAQYTQSYFLVGEGRYEDSVSAYYIQLFRQKLSHKTVKGYATIPIGIMGSKSFALFHRVSRLFSNKEGESMNARACAVSFHHAETP